jgi:hypothetical protein
VPDQGPAALAHAFIDAMNAYDADALTALLAEDAELRGFKGSFVGRDSAPRWLGSPGPNLRSRIDVVEMRENETRALAVADRIWIWVDSGEEAERERWHGVWWTGAGLIERWQPFHYLPEAVEAFESGEPQPVPR